MRLILLLCFVWLMDPRPAVAQMVEEPNGEFPSLGKTKDLARSDLEFRLPSTGIRSYALSDFGDSKQILLVAADSQACPDGSIEDSLRRSKGHADLTIVMLDVAINANREKIASRVSSQSFVYLFDPLQNVASSFGLEAAGDFVLLDAKTLQTKWSGNLGRPKDVNSPQMPKQLSQVQPSKEIASVAELCSLRFEPTKVVNFKNDFVRPFTRACLSCHIASESHDEFKTLDQVQGWRAMSLRLIRLGRMPGRYDPYYGAHPTPTEGADVFSEPSNEDLRKVVAWLSGDVTIDDGMRKEFLEARARISRPLLSKPTSLPVQQSLKLETPIQVAAEGIPIFKNTFVGKPLEADVQLQGLFLRTNLNVVHHVTVLALNPEFVDAKLFEKSGAMSNQFLGQFYGPTALRNIPGWLDGRKTVFRQVLEPILTIFGRRAGTMLYSNDSAVTLKKGTQIAVQMHVEPSGKAELAPLEFDLLARASPQPFSELKRFSVKPDRAFKLKPGIESYVVSSEVKFDRPIRLKVVSVHTHYRGIAARFQIENSKGQRQTIASLPFMQVKMDRRFVLPEQGRSIEAGSRLKIDIEYDNSDRNVGDPDPLATVGLGGRTFEDEMYYPTVQYIER